MNFTYLTVNMFPICFHIKLSTDFQQVWRLLNHRITCVPMEIIGANDGNSLSCVETIYWNYSDFRFGHYPEGLNPKWIHMICIKRLTNAWTRTLRYKWLSKSFWLSKICIYIQKTRSNNFILISHKEIVVSLQSYRNGTGSIFFLTIYLVFIQYTCLMN